MIRKTLLTIISIASLSAAAHAEIRIAIDVSGDNVDIRNSVESAFRNALSNIPDVALTSDNPDATIYVSAMPANGYIAFSTAAKQSNGAFGGGGLATFPPYRLQASVDNEVKYLSQHLLHNLNKMKEQAAIDAAVAARK